MTATSSGFGSKMVSQQPRLKTWAVKAAIRAVLREGDPEIADMIFGTLNDIPLDARGRRITPRRVG